MARGPATLRFLLDNARRMSIHGAQAPYTSLLLPQWSGADAGEALCLEGPGPGRLGFLVFNRRHYDSTHFMNAALEQRCAEIECSLTERY